MSWVLILETINEAMPSKSLISFERETNEFDIEAKKKKNSAAIFLLSLI